MREEIWIGKKSLRFWYYRYKDSPYFSFSIISVTIITCFILIVQVIIPQVQTWFSIRDEVIATGERITALRNNISYMNSLDKPLLTSQLDTATTALPSEKDFSAILNAIFESALQSGVSLGDFSFNVGNVAATAGTSTNPAEKNLSSIEITLVLSSNLDGAKRFLAKVKEKLPLSEVVKMEGNLQSTTVTVRFFQKPFAKIDYKDTEPIPPVSANNQQLLQKISAWKVNTSQQSLSLPSGTSAERIPLF